MQNLRRLARRLQAHSLRLQECCAEYSRDTRGFHAGHRRSRALETAVQRGQRSPDGALASAARRPRREAGLLKGRETARWYFLLPCFADFGPSVVAMMCKTCDTLMG